MKKIKNIILLLIIVIIIISVILVYVISNKNANQNDDSNILYSEEMDLVEKNNFEPESNINTFFSKENTINMFLSYIYSQESNMYNSQILYALLDEEYINQNRNNRE